MIGINLYNILKRVQEGKFSPEEAKKLLQIDYLEKIENTANLDLGRELRLGLPEVIFAEPKTLESIMNITEKFLNKNGYIFLSRVKEEQRKELERKYKDNERYYYRHNDSARTIFIEKKGNKLKEFLPDSKYKDDLKVGIITAGTSDIPVAEEAAEFLNIIGITTFKAYDVGIAGFHRIFKPLKEFIERGVLIIIVVAGMEGTLPGVVSALVDMPVIGVPTSTGYGFGEKGLGALTTMLQSCSPGLSVVNIDNGFGAAATAARICLQYLNLLLNRKK